MYYNVSGIILSGGKNIRMGINKSLLKINGESVIELIAKKVQNLFQDVLLISNEPELYSFLNVRLFRDVYPSKGPMSGIHSGLVNSTTDKNFFISCDLPLIKKEFIEYMINYKSDKLIVLPSANNYIQTLSGVYHKKCIPYLESRLRVNTEDGLSRKQRRYSLIEFFMEVGAEIVDVTSLPFYEKNIFLNLTKIEDYETVKQSLK
ncbi:MAG: hypothetical protein A2V66_00405 [Ignavibacteria bacterium RBG_13_36_8]|nr:MAG: hypothetical protein A2V66_00405 [Ignavibacteria bacterium RBG_13_36_8]